MNTMKKTLLYSLATMASLALASCAGDYDDWANPQANEQEASAAKYGVTFANGSEAEGSMADEDGIINLVTVNSTDANVSGFTLQDFKVNGVAVNGTMVGNSVQVSASELEKLVCEQNKSRASVARDLKVETQVSINLASGDAVSITTKGETTGKFTPTATPQLDEKGYYMLGQVNGNEWDAKSPVWMNKISDGVYQLKVTTTADKNWFKFYAGSNFVSEDWDSINKGALGCKENGSEDTFGYILYDGDSWGELQTPVIPGAGTWIVTLDMNNLTYTVGKPVLYMAGDANGWATNDYLAGEDGVHFTGFMYLNQNGFKFCTQPEWKGTNYGADFNTAADAANITMTEEAGYYKVDVDLESKSYVLTPITTIGIIGSASPYGWDSDVDMTYVPYNAETKALGYWEAKDITLASGEIKFRANDDWAINWGGDTNALTQGGDNISVEAGTYDIKLYAWANGYAKCELIKK
ncbi:MAG: Outer membrane protein SusF domain-containing protein [Segatella copri]